MAYLCQMQIIMAESATHANQQSANPEPASTVDLSTAAKAVSNDQTIEAQPIEPAKIPVQIKSDIESSSEQKDHHPQLPTDPSEATISAPSMWTRKEHKEFIASLRSDTDSIVTVGCGEIVKVCA